MNTLLLSALTPEEMVQHMYAGGQDVGFLFDVLDDAAEADAAREEAWAQMEALELRITAAATNVEAAVRALQHTPDEDKAVGEAHAALLNALNHLEGKT